MIKKPFFFKILLFFLIPISISSCASNKYRLVDISYGIDSKMPNTQVLLPPKSKLAIKNTLYEKDSKVKEQYVFIEGLGTEDYFEALENVDGASYVFNLSKLKVLLNKPSYVFLSSWGEVKFYSTKSPITTDTLNLTSLVKNIAIVGDLKPTKVLITINYDKIFGGKGDGFVDPVIHFNNMGLELLQVLSFIEVEYDWPDSIAQSITEKTFELVPIAQESSLARFGYKVTDKYYTVLLNPKFRLRIEHSMLTKTSDKYGGIKKDVYSFSGSSYSSFTRNSFGKNKQAYLSDFDKQYLASSKIGRKDFGESPDKLEVTYYNIASSVDLEFSKELYSSRYLAIYHSFLRSNINDLPLGGGDDSPDEICGANALEWVPSIIFFKGQLNELYQPLKECRGIPIYTRKASFGERSYVTIEIPLDMNGLLSHHPLGISGNDLMQTKMLTRDYSVSRKFNGSLKKVQNQTSNYNDLILLPGDQIKYD